MIDLNIERKKLLSAAYEILPKGYPGDGVLFLKIEGVVHPGEGKPGEGRNEDEVVPADESTDIEEILCAFNFFFHRFVKFERVVAEIDRDHAKQFFPILEMGQRTGGAYHAARRYPP